MTIKTPPPNDKFRENFDRIFRTQKENENSQSGNFCHHCAKKRKSKRVELKEARND